MPKVLLLSRQPLTERPLHEWLDNTAQDIVLVTTPEAVAGAEDILAEHFPHHRLVPDYDSWATEQAAEEAAREYGVDLVASTSEGDVLRAARLRARLGLTGQSTASATAYRDKVVMKQLARAAGVRVPAFAPIDDPMDLLDFIDAEGFPVVVKPRSGARSVGVAILRTPADLTAFLGREPDSVPFLPGQWMAESFARGDFFHVDGIMRDGRTVHAWPSRYTGGLAERIRDETHVGSVLLDPDDSRVPALLGMTEEVIAALPGSPLGLAFHLEAWIGEDGVPVLCEIASRAGGALIAETYERGLGIQLAREGLRAQCGSPLALECQPTAPSAAIGWLLLAPGHGRFVPPAEPCPVPGIDLELLLEAGTPRQGVEHVADAAAHAFIQAEGAEQVRARLDELTDWWHTNTAWRP